MPYKKIKILLADDDQDDRLFFRDAINSLKIDTSLVLVKNGMELMDYLKEPENDLPEVIFLDLNMPGMNGFQCLSQIRKDDRLQTLTVAIYSTSSDQKDIEEALVKGANIYINKPNDFKDLKAVLNKVITTNWQYLNSGFNNESFLMSV
jgi:CheY-like chemotaxis protein